MSINRSRHHIVLGQGWRAHTRLVDGLQMLGTIQRGMNICALAIDSTNHYVGVAKGHIEILNQRKTHAAVEAAQSIERAGYQPMESPEPIKPPVRHP